MKKITFPIPISTCFSFLANVDAIISLYQRVFLKSTDKIKITQMENIDNTRIVIQIMSIIITFLVSYYFLTHLQKLSNRLKLALIVSNVRDIVSFDEKYGHIKSAFMPTDTIESYLSRTPENKYAERLQDEIKKVRELSINQFSHLNIEEIDKLISDTYFLTHSTKK